MRILLAQNDPDELDITAYALHRQGYRVLTAVDGKTAIAKWRSEDPDLILIDTMLPKINGLEVCRLVRGESQVPLIFLSERSGDQDVVTALNLGADDYVVKPFSASQLVARIRAALRRATNSQTRSDGLDSTVIVGNLAMNSEEHKVTLAGEVIHLTPLEFRLLYCLVANKGRVMSTDQLIDHAWGLRDGGYAGVLKTHISRLRQKLEAGDPQREYIKNVPGVGYCIIEQESLSPPPAWELQPMPLPSATPFQEVDF